MRLTVPHFDTLVLLALLSAGCGVEERFLSLPQASASSYVVVVESQSTSVYAGPVSEERFTVRFNASVNSKVTLLLYGETLDALGLQEGPVTLSDGCVLSRPSFIRSTTVKSEGPDEWIELETLPDSVAALLVGNLDACEVDACVEFELKEIALPDVGGKVGAILRLDEARALVFGHRGYANEYWAFLVDAADPSNPRALRDMPPAVGGTVDPEGTLWVLTATGAVLRGNGELQFVETGLRAPPPAGRWEDAELSAPSAAGVYIATTPPAPDADEVFVARNNTVSSVEQCPRTESAGSIITDGRRVIATCGDKGVVEISLEDDSASVVSIPFQPLDESRTLTVLEDGTPILASDDKHFFERRDGRWQELIEEGDPPIPKITVGISFGDGALFSGHEGRLQQWSRRGGFCPPQYPVSTEQNVWKAERFGDGYLFGTQSVVPPVLFTAEVP